MAELMPPEGVLRVSVRAASNGLWSRRRAGFAFGKEPVELARADFGEGMEAAQRMIALCRDPMLRVVFVQGEDEQELGEAEVDHLVAGLALAAEAQAATDRLTVEAAATTGAADVAAAILAPEPDPTIADASIADAQTDTAPEDGQPAGGETAPPAVEPAVVETTATAQPEATDPAKPAGRKGKRA